MRIRGVAPIRGRGGAERLLLLQKFQFLVTTRFEAKSRMLCDSTDCEPEKFVQIAKLSEKPNALLIRESSLLMLDYPDYNCRARIV